MNLKNKGKCDVLIELKKRADNLAECVSKAPSNLRSLVNIARKFSEIFDMICAVEELNKKEFTTTQSFELINKLKPESLYFETDARNALVQLQGDFGCLQVAVFALKATDTTRSLNRSLSEFNKSLIKLLNIQDTIQEPASIVSLG